MDSFLLNLFKYYNFQLSVDNVINTSVNRDQLKEIFFNTNITKIKEKYSEKLKQKIFFNLSSEFKKEILPIAPISKFDDFSEFSVFYERALNVEAQNKPLNPANDSEDIENHKEFQCPHIYNFQYGIAFNLVPEKPLETKISHIPAFVLLFDFEDKDHYPITLPEVLLCIKNYLQIELTDNEKEELPDYEPFLVFNPKLIEPYSLKSPEFKISNYTETKKNIDEHLKEIFINFSDIDKNLQIEPYLIGIPQNLNRGLKFIYNSIFKEKEINNTLKTYFRINERKKYRLNYPTIQTKDIITSKKVIESYKKHLGSFDKKYPLAKTQREAFACYMENKRILPVNGAPGTGKTSLLRAISGDYTVKAAINCYIKYRKENIVNFSTPIVCSSTNNQALHNISEGISEGFTSLIKSEPDNILYKRWFIKEIEVSKKKIDFNTDLFLPSLKFKIKEKYELSISDITQTLNTVSQSPLFYIHNYFSYRGSGITYDTIDKKTIKHLKEAAHYFYEKITRNIKEIKNSIEIENLEELENLEIEIIEKYIKKGIQEDIIKLTLNKIKSNYKTFDEILNKIDSFIEERESLDVDKEFTLKEIDKLKTESKEIRSIISDFSEDIKDIDQLLPIEEKLSKEAETSPYYNQEYQKEKYSQAQNLEKELDKIKEQCKVEINLTRQNSSILEKVAQKLFNKGKLSDKIKDIQDTFKQKLKEFEKEFYMSEIFLNTINQTVSTIHKKKIESLNQQRDDLDSKITEKIHLLDKIELDISIQENRLFLIDEELFAVDNSLDYELSLFETESISLEDIKRFVKYQKTYKELEYNRKSSEPLDIKQRTDNFYYALHLLEAMFFIKNKHIWNGAIESESYSSKSTLCPICKEGTMVQSKDKIICNKCRKFYSFNNEYNPKDLSITQVLYILSNNEDTIIEDKKYTVSANGKYINIKSKSSSVKEAFSFNNIFPLYPMISITCNSFGSIVATQGEVSPDLFEFLLIDESGTIPASKMIILYCAKRAMLFGDEKQLKPVFPYDNKVEEKILEDFGFNPDEVELITSYYSCASKGRDEIIIKKNNNAMAIANSSVNYFLPYNNSKMEGDIWLKEHFRCKNPIVSISNEIAYSNEIIPSKPDKKEHNWSNLLFVNHESTMTKQNTNYEEAMKIIGFIQERKDLYMNNFLKVLNEDDQEITENDYYSSIGIVTPFSNQESLFKKLIIEKIGSDPSNNKEPIVKVGTVHKFQGSEREIIIFSSTYGKESIGRSKNLFFNREDPDMINVAVTRAKEIFVLYGNRDVLNDQSTYAGKMLKHIDSYINDKK